MWKDGLSLEARIEQSALPDRSAESTLSTSFLHSIGNVLNDAQDRSLPDGGLW